SLSKFQIQLQIINGLRPQIYEGTAKCYADLMKRCWNIKPKERPTAKEICDIFTKWRNSKYILFELSESDEKLQNIKNEDTQANIECYISSFISFKASGLDELNITD
ncbi:10104_t:CDS:2, partial [Cetraspora pellucida]